MKRTGCAPRILSCCYVLLGVMQMVGLLVASERRALAYIDPGSGFVFLQVAGSMVAGAAYYLRHRVKRILGLMRKPSVSSSPAPASAEVVENRS